MVAKMMVADFILLAMSGVFLLNLSRLVRMTLTHASRPPALMVEIIIPAAVIYTWLYH